MSNKTVSVEIELSTRQVMIKKNQFPMKKHPECTVQLTSEHTAYTHTDADTSAAHAVLAG